MPWTVAHKSEGIEQIVTNILAYIAANQAAALAPPFLTVTLTPFDPVFNSSAGRVFTNLGTAPAMAITDVESDTEESDDGMSVEVKHRIGFQMMVADGDPDALTLKLYRYMRSVMAMIRSMTDAELTLNMTSTRHAQVLAMTARYDRRLFTNEAGQYLRQMFLGVEIELREAG